MNRLPNHSPSRAGLLGWAVAMIALLIAAPATEAQGRRSKATIESVADRSSYQPGEAIRLAVRVFIDDGWHLQSNTPSFEYLIPTELFVTASDGLVGGEVLYPPHIMWQSTFEAEPLAVYEHEVVLLTSIPIPADFSGSEVVLSSELAYQACDERVCLPPTEARHEIAVAVGEAGEPVAAELFDRALAELEGGESAAATSGPTGGGGGSLPSLISILFAGLLGGLILNAMPCVLPVLSLKVLGVVQAAGHGAAKVRTGMLATAAGILVSFWALAAGVFALRGAGQAVGWGIQFQNPAFVAFLALVVLLFSLNLWGLFEIRLPAALTPSGSQRDGLAGHFAGGLFATLMATPCSAPFLGTAVGFALSQSALVIVLVFTAVGLGMASPYLLLAARPQLASVLPKPGAWMETLRGVLGFLLAGAVIWLMFVLAAQLSPVTLALFQGTLVAIGLFAWLAGRASQAAREQGRSSSTRARLSTVAMVVLAVVGLGLAQRADGNGRVVSENGDGIPWVDFDRGGAEQRSAGGELVFVDVTADWCATCKVNERVVLGHPEVVDAFAANNVVAMRADWTNRDDAIAQYLADFGRYAIPFYVLYRPGREPHVFGELLTRGSVLSVLEESAGAKVAER